MNTQEFETRIQKMKDFFSAKQYYWNGGIDVSINNGSIGLTEDSNSTNSNKYNGYQCHGFAQFFLAVACGCDLKVIPDLNPEVSYPWIIYDNLQDNADFGDFQIGDLIRTDGWGFPHVEHSAIVVGIDGENVTVIQSLYGKCMINVGVFNDDPKDEANPVKNPSMTKTFLREHCRFAVRCSQNYLNKLTNVEVYLKDTNGVDRSHVFEVSNTRYFNLPDVNSIFSAGEEPEENYEHTGWWTRHEGEAKRLSNGDPISDSDFYVTSHRSLYARITRCKVEVKFDENYGNNASHTETREVGVPIGSLPVPSSRTYYTFVGWVTERDGANVIGTDFTVPNYPFSLYACWNQKKSKITLKDNYEGGSEQTVEKFSGDRIGSLPVPSSRTYFTFVGWVTERNGTNVLGSDFIVPNYDFNLYAYWERNKHTVFLDDNYEGGRTQTVEKYAGLPINTLPETSRNYYDFKGWVTEKDGTDAIGQDFIVPDYWFRLYAYWKRKECKVRYFDNEESTILESETVDCGSDYTVCPSFFIDCGYDFKGWKNKNDNKVYYPGDTIFLTSDIDLVMQWEEKNAVIHFDTGGLFELSPLSLTYSDAIKRFGDGIIPCSYLPYGTSDYTVSGWKIKGGDLSLIHI